jgi:hypothetical protein
LRRRIVKTNEISYIPSLYISAVILLSDSKENIDIWGKILARYVINCNKIKKSYWFKEALGEGTFG